jgi:hypothetical protein
MFFSSVPLALSLAARLGNQLQGTTITPQLDLVIARGVHIATGRPISSGQRRGEDDGLDLAYLLHERKISG